MVRDLGIDIEVVTCPTVRDQDGLAMSSRNAYLSATERKRALVYLFVIAAGGKTLVQRRCNQSNRTRTQKNAFCTRDSDRVR